MCALHAADPPTGEEEVGIMGFMTSGPGIGGRLRARAEHFVVEEVPMPPPEVAGGAFTALTVRLTNWETNRFVRQMSRRLGISHKRVRFAGVKDKRAVTTQLMTVEASPESVAGLRMTDVEVLSRFPTDRHVSLGDLLGNRFGITVSGVELDEAEVRGRFETIMDEVRRAGGFPNFYGPQRFGVTRPVSHLVGHELVRGDVEAACWTYLTHQGPGEEEAARDARRRLAETRDVRQALRDFPKTLGHELNMLDHLLHHPQDPEGALRRLPFNLLLMFVHAYQGLVFNTVLSERLSRDLPIAKPMEGDILVPLDEHRNPDPGRAIPVSSRNLAKAEAQVERGRAAVTGIVPGTKAPLAEGEMGELEASGLERMGLEAGHFRIVGLTELTSAGIRRELALTGVEPTWAWSDHGPSMGFRLPRGCYATVVMRELMKAPMQRY